jgi:hypothetical protein
MTLKEFFSICQRKNSVVAGLAFANAKNVNAVLAIRSFEVIAGFPDEIGNVNFGKRIRAFDVDDVIARQARKRLARSQCWKRAFQSAQVEGRFGHCASWLASTLLPVTLKRVSLDLIRSGCVTAGPCGTPSVPRHGRPKRWPSTSRLRRGEAWMAATSAAMTCRGRCATRTGRNTERLVRFRRKALEKHELRKAGT